MSKLQDALRAIKVFNNHNLLTRFGGPDDVAVEYHPSPRGRLGYAQCDKTKVWSPRPHRDLKRDERGLGSVYQKEFLGNRKETFDRAIIWAAAALKVEFATSPFGGRVPKRVLDKAKEAALPKKRRTLTGEFP